MMPRLRGSWRSCQTHALWPRDVLQSVDRCLCLFPSGRLELPEHDVYDFYDGISMNRPTRNALHSLPIFVICDEGGEGRQRVRAKFGPVAGCRGGGDPAVP